jgi:hypothetical protein
MEEAKNLEEKDPEAADMLLSDVKFLQAWKLHDIIPVIRWLSVRRKIERWQIDDVVFHKIAISNWQKLAEVVSSP